MNKIDIENKVTLMKIDKDMSEVNNKIDSILSRMLDAKSHDDSIQELIQK